MRGPAGRHSAALHERDAALAGFVAGRGVLKETRIRSSLPSTFFTAAMAFMFITPYFCLEILSPPRRRREARADPHHLAEGLIIKLYATARVTRASGC